MNKIKTEVCLSSYRCCGPCSICKPNKIWIYKGVKYRDYGDKIIDIGS